MQMKLKNSVFAAGLAIALPFGLAACGDDGGKPSKEDVQAGIDTAVSQELEATGVTQADFETLGITQDDFDALYSCVVDDIYDDVSDETLRIFAESDTSAGISEEDGRVFEAAMTACASHIQP